MSNHDPTDLIGQERAARERQKAMRSESYLIADDMKWLMGSKRGRRIMHRILDRSGIYRSSFTGNSETFFREGERNIGLVLMSQILDVCPDSFTLMMKEKNERSSNDSNSSDAGTN